MAAAACAAGALTATTVAEGITPWANAPAQVASSVSAGQGTTETAQLDARIIPEPGTAAGANAATSAQALIPASEWARALGFASVKDEPAAQTPAAHATPAAATVKVKPVQAPAAQPKAAKAAPARKAAAKAAPVHVAPAKPYLIYDSVTPTSIPAGQRVAVYANGLYQASWSSVAGRGKVLWIDTKGNNPGANVLDVEPGDATPAGAAHWVKARLNTYQNQLAIVYTYLSAWQAVKASVASLPSWMQAKVRYWIADPTGVNHVVAGSNATQWYWGKSYDVTTANPGLEAR